MKRGWEQRLTPFSIIRKVGPFGTGTAIKAAINRMPGINP